MAEESIDETSQAAPDGMPRRSFLGYLGGGLAGALASRSLIASAAEEDRIEMPPIQAPTEKPEKAVTPKEPPPKRVGYAVVGLGRLAIGEVLPAIAKSKRSRVVALVSGDADKAGKVARQYAVRPDSIYDYGNYGQLADNPEVDAVYIALPNGMHAEFTIRAARAGKHVLCEKPMAISVRQCETMIAACEAAKKKLMIAYRSQYEPMDRAIVKMIRDKKLGELREFVSVNSQNVGDPGQWRLKHELSGGGPLADLGIYSINAARFLSGEEPFEVTGSAYRRTSDPRFQEVEESAHFILRFPSGLTATCATSFATHRSQFFRVHGSEAWAEMNPAFSYHGLEMRIGRVENGEEILQVPRIDPVDQFVAEIDHMSWCIRNDVKPHTPGEEGLQDMRIIEAIYESARSGSVVKISTPTLTRGPEPVEEA
ncbi:MAG TPA: Gfo/Idh/MocA family oxidoreductase [Burkholderiales bacterium]|nr:Gfo/Idh/MocA family oxidoreductase [Burkholderiales bacterium]